MTPALKLMTAAFVLALAPASALAQTWPGIAVASVPAMSQSRTTVAALTPLRARGAPRVVALNMKTRKADLTPVAPDFEVRAKPEWSDDQGFRISPTRVAFKSRF